MEVTTIPDIRERNDRPKDKQPKHQAVSIVQRQMVQRFVKELNDSANRPDRSDSAERTATEQVEMTAREIVHEAVQLPRRAIQHPARRESADSSADIQPKQSDQSHHAPESPRQRTDTPRTRSDAMQPQRTSAPSPPEQPRSQHTTVTTPTVENTPRQRTEDIRTRPEPQRPQSKPIPAPQERGRRAYAKRTKKSRAGKTSARDNLYTEQPEIRPADDLPERESLPIREKPDIPEIRGQVQSEAAPAKPSAVRHVKQPDTWTPRSAAVPVMRGKEQSIRERPAVTQAHDLPPAPQEQPRQAFVKKQAQLSQSPSAETIYPSEPATLIPPQLPVSDAPTITPERQPITAGSKPVPPVQPPPTQSPPAERLPAIREKQKPNAAPREKSRRGVSIRTIDTEQISTPKVQPKTPASKTAAKRARKSATQDAQRKMLQKSNNRATRAAAAAAKKLAEAAAKAVKELISAFASLGGGTALFVVFSIVIVAGAFLASPLGILFADEQKSEDTVPLATAIAEIQGEYHAELERLQNGDFESAQIVGQAPDWREVVAVFASKTAGAEDGVDVFTLDAERVELLRQVFWDMCEITTATQTVDVPDSNPDDDVDDSHTGIALTITITAKTAEQMRLIYAFTKYQNDALDVLLENLGSLNIPMGSLTISQEDAIALLENLPDDLDPERKAVVETAVQLVGRVSYFWGGKSLTLGWDDRWGVPTEVTAAGSGSTGTIRPFGLDCSGFVDWTFYNATNGSYYPGRGGGAATQHSYCTNIAWSDAQPGDLVFYPADVHVGIVGGRDADGNLLIVHCSGGANGVVITGSAGFTSVARPDCFS